MFFFFNDTATTEIYTLSLHDALPILGSARSGYPGFRLLRPQSLAREEPRCGTQSTRNRLPSTNHGGCCQGDRKSTRLNSSHANISYAVFCLKKKTNNFHCLLLYTYTH